jgi:hypothetical protein
VIHNLSIVHVLLILAATVCISLAVRKQRQAHTTQLALFAPGLTALFIGAVLFLIQISAGQPAWPFGIAAAIGFFIGAARGFMIGITHDRYRPELFISPSAKLTFVGVAAAIGACVVLEVVGAYMSPELEKVRLWAALSAVVCAVAMLARALVLAVRLHRYG